MQYIEKAFVKEFVWILAAISSAVTLIGFLFQEEVNKASLSPCIKLLFLVVLALFCALYATAMTDHKNKVTFSFNHQFKLTVEKGDIFDKKGVIVIPVNEYFDTHVGDGIISQDSVHGKFINRFFSDRIQELDRKINEQLTKEKVVGRSKRVNAKENRYNIGTCIDISEGENTYVLVALTRFDDENHAFLEKHEYPRVIDALLKHLENLAVEQPVYMPLIGTGLSRLGRSPQRILNFIFDAIDFKHSLKIFPKGLFIEIYNINEVNLNKLENLVEHELKL